MVGKTKIVVEPLDPPQRGPGGHNTNYRAYYYGVPEVYGDGATEREAKQSLLKLTQEQEAAKTKVNSDQVGWFVWTKKNGEIYYHKYIVEGDHIHTDTKKYYEGFEIKKFPLDKIEWALYLDDLAKKYPLSDDLKAQHDVE